MRLELIILGGVTAEHKCSYCFILYYCSDVQIGKRSVNENRIAVFCFFSPCMGSGLFADCGGRNSL